MSLPYGRIHNFSAGPAAMPLSVIEQLREQLPNCHDTGVGLMEMSHRSTAFAEIVAQAKARVRRVLGLPSDYTVLFLQGGASTQFLMGPMNLLRGDSADYLDTGRWSVKAIKEAQRFGTVNVPWSAAEQGYDEVPSAYEPSDGAVYTHFTSNNTVAGTQFPAEPAGERLVCDMSSDIASRPIDASRYALIYAGAQKNLGPSGVTLVVLSPWAVERADPDAPTMLSYLTHVNAKGTLFNTPNTLGIFALERVLAWIEERGVERIAANNRAKAGRLYDLFDSSDFWVPHAKGGSRSLMNVTWRLADRELEATLIAEATEAGLSGLKGHRSVGGLRASMYNACPQESVDALVDFLTEFERVRG